MDREEAKGIVENILFIADAPIAADRFVALFNGEFTREETNALIEEVQKDYENRSLQVVEVAEGWRLQTRPEYAQWITGFYKMEKGQKLSRASLEVLAIIAYRQPITRAEIDQIRGVDSGGVLRGLVEKNLVKTMGRRKAPGRPMMYGTTSRFMEHFGLARLTDLPTLDDLDMEAGESFPELVRQESIAFEENEETPDDETDGDADRDIDTDRDVDTDRDEHETNHDDGG